MPITLIQLDSGGYEIQEGVAAPRHISEIGYDSDNNQNESDSKIYLTGIRGGYETNAYKFDQWSIGTQSGGLTTSFTDLRSVSNALYDIGVTLKGSGVTGGGGGGDASEAKQQEVIDLLTGGLKTPDLIESVVDGSTDSGVESFSIIFLGTGGTLDGVDVPNGFSANYTPLKGDDTIDSIPYTVPTSAGGRVLISYIR